MFNFKNDEMDEVRLLYTEIDPEDDGKLWEQSQFELAIRYYRAGDFIKAQSQFNFILEQNPKDFESKHYLGKIAIKLKNWNVAARYYAGLDVTPYASNQIFQQEKMALLETLNKQAFGYFDLINFKAESLEECDEALSVAKKAIEAALLSIELGESNDLPARIDQSIKPLKDKRDELFQATRFKKLKEDYSTRPALNKEASEAELVKIVGRFARLKEDAYQLLKSPILLSTERKQVAGMFSQLNTEYAVIQAQWIYASCSKNYSDLPSIIHMNVHNQQHWLNKLETISMRLETFILIHDPCAKLYDKIRMKYNEIKKLILKERVGHLASQAFQSSIVEYEVGDRDKSKIQRVLSDALIHNPPPELTHALTHSSALEFSHQIEHVSRTLTHYYSHKKTMLICNTNVLQLSDGFEREAVKEVRKAILNH